MVQHIVMWKIKESEKISDVYEKMQIIFAALLNEVPGLKTLGVHRGFSGYDLCLISEHQNQEALQIYQECPAHQEIKKYVHSVICERASIDFEAD